MENPNFHDPKYTQFMNKMFIQSPALRRAEKIFLEKEEKLNLDEFKNILVNVYFLSRSEISEEPV